VDLSWASPCLVDSVDKWSVLGNVESLSDHQYIQVVLRTPSSFKRSRISTLKRWNFKKLDCELFTEALEFLADAKMPDDLEFDPERYVSWLMSIMKNACNIAAPLVSCKNKRRQVYWWSGDISNLRSSSELGDVGFGVSVEMILLILPLKERPILWQRSL